MVASRLRCFPMACCVRRSFEVSSGTVRDEPEVKPWQNRFAGKTSEPQARSSQSVLKMADRAPSPTPSERAKQDKEAKAKEVAEQASLPYRWTQQIGDLDLTAPIPGNLKGKDLDVKITKTSLKAGIKGQDAIIDVRHDFKILLQSSWLSIVNRAPYHIPSTPTNPHGPSKPCQAAAKS